jgi:hypothetical protein
VQCACRWDAGERVELTAVVFIYPCTSVAAIPWSAVDITMLWLLWGVLQLKVTTHTIFVSIYLSEGYWDTVL